MSTATHVRQHNSVLAAAEKRALIWIATRLPRWVNSDHLSALGLAVDGRRRRRRSSSPQRILLPAHHLWCCACC